MLIDSEALSAKILETLERDLGPSNSWRLALNPAAAQGERITWHGERGGQPWQSTSEPDASMWRKLQVDFFRLLNLEDLL